MSVADIVGMAIALSLVALLLFMLMLWVISAIVESVKRKKPFRCCLGMHKPDKANIGFDGLSLTCKCKRCGEDLLQDSQGNWF